MAWAFVLWAAAVVGVSIQYPFIAPFLSPVLINAFEAAKLAGKGFDWANPPPTDDDEQSEEDQPPAEAQTRTTSTTSRASRRSPTIRLGSSTTTMSTYSTICLPPFSITKSSATSWISSHRGHAPVRRLILQVGAHDSTAYSDARSTSWATSSSVGTSATWKLPHVIRNIARGGRRSDF